MKAAVIIPSRMAATRLPGKPLVKIAGMTMIEHVFRRCALAVGEDSVWIATCDREIQDAGRSFGAKVVMTSDQHVRCTDRVAEAAREVKADVIINVQGDEPVMDPEALQQVLRPFKEKKECFASNLIQKIDTSVDDPRNYNIVKVAFNLNRQALYFSREAIPTPQRTTDVRRNYYRQIGLIAFRRDFLETFSRLTPTPLEAAESVDMMRMLEHGYPLDLVETQSRFLSVDVPEDLPAVEEALRNDVHFPKYRPSK